MPVFASSAVKRLFPARTTRALVLAAAAVGLSAPHASAQQPAPAPEIENAKHQMEGVLNRAEFVRAGAADNAYVTMKLDKGDKVVVVGAKNNWLKIVPPAGSFSLVPKVAIQRFGNGKQGKATGTNTIVRAGSSIQSGNFATQCALRPNETVEILADEEPFYKIKPPAGAYLYILKESVDAQAPAEAAPARPAAVGGARAGRRPAACRGRGCRPGDPAAVSPRPSVVPPPAGEPAMPPATGPAGAAPAAAAPRLPNDYTPINPGTPLPTPAADPAPAATGDGRPLNVNEAVNLLQQLEPQFAEASKKPLTEQPLADLVSAYEQIAATPGINEPTKRWVQNRVQTLKNRIDARDHLLASQQKQQANQQRLTAQRAEGQEIAAKMKGEELQLFAVVGTLRTSSVQVSKTPLYRVTDPSTGRTLAYVWATDPKVPTLVDQFIGLRGPIQTHPKLNLRVVNPTTVEVLDPAKLNVAYNADVAPPSLLPKAPTASTEQ